MRYLKASGKKIKIARRSAGLTQSQLGEKMGVTGSMVGQYETEIRHPSLKTINQIADLLSVDVMDLMDEVGSEDAMDPSEKAENLIALKQYQISVPEESDIIPFLKAARDAVAGEDISSDDQTMQTLRKLTIAFDNDTLLHASSIKAHAEEAIPIALKALDNLVLDICHDENAKTDAQRLRELEVMPVRIGQVKDFIKANQQFLKKNMSFPVPADNKKE